MVPEIFIHEHSEKHLPTIDAYFPIGGVVVKFEKNRT